MNPNINSEIEVTVVCMSFNQEDYIEQCLKSLVSQRTNFKYEIIVHDDASTDTTAMKIKRFAQSHPEIVLLLQNENQYSQGKNIRKLIMPYIHGRYISLCEGDDWWCDVNKLQIQYDLMQSDQSIAACAHAVRLFSEERQKFNGALAPRSTKCKITTDEIIREIAPFGTNSLFFKTQYYLMPDEYMGWVVGDYPLCIWLSINGKFVYLPDMMSVYRMNAKGSWSERMKRADYAIHQNMMIIDGLLRFNAATDEKYSEAVQNAILDYRISNCVLEQDIKGLLANDCRSRIAEFPLKRKLSTFAKCFTPRLFSLINRYWSRG